MPEPVYGPPPGAPTAGASYARSSGEDLPLAAPPRRVPAVMHLGLFAWRGWELFTVVMVVVAPLALWIFLPAGLPVMLGLVLAVVVGYRWRLHRQRMRVLRWGKVATVTDVTTSPTSTSYTNVPMRQARGWRTTSRAYTGQGVRSEVAFEVEEAPGRLVLKGLPYAGGVVLADPRRTADALCISSVPFSVAPGPDGELAVHVSLWQGIGAGLTLGLYAALAGIAVIVAGHTWT
ncbi:hypothetical protein [Nocardioides sp. SYSU D00038]|uniref:hypothetical protein n=1 Tax=Nocardioides sp. SYSU D00038 TaxID=2812554 RepID=UPI001967E9CD|nr:hypothetical protein [Nocardioides sp. SYSU D00038]